MLNTLITAIARLLGLQPTVKATVQLTQTAGHAPQEPTTPRGKRSSAPTTKSKPVAQKPKRKPKAAPSTTPAKSSKRKPKPAQPAGKASGVTGSQRPTPASKTRQHAKPAAKRKP